jgi:hypothetical protein
MASALDSISLGLAGAGMLVLLLGSTFGTSWRAAIPVTVEVWTAAGLLRLAGEPSWTRIATAAAIIAVRRLIVSRAPAATRRRRRAAARATGPARGRAG